MVSSASSVLTEKSEPMIRYLMMHCGAYAFGVHRSREQPVPIRLVSSPYSQGSTYDSAESLMRIEELKVVCRDDGG